LTSSSSALILNGLNGSLRKSALIRIDSLTLNDKGAQKMSGFSKLWHWLAAGAWGLSVLTAASDAASGADQAPQRIRVTGSSTIAPVMLEISARYSATHNSVLVDVETGGSSRGIADALMHRSQLGMVPRAPKESDTGVTFFEIAKDGLAVIAHANNPVQAITSAHLKDVYRGRITNWQALGGPDQPITVVSKAAGRSTLEVFLEHTQLKASEIKASVIIGDNQQAIKTVQSIPWSIAYVSIGSALLSAQSGAQIRLFTLDGVEAKPETVADGSYPMSRSLNLVYSGTPSAETAELLKFVHSDEAQAIIRSQSFVPVAK
jgi:phosphate transport system substrate-binding protein